MPAVEVMFKAFGDRVLAKTSAVVPAWAPWLTVATSPNGSYREYDVLDFIEQRLEPMTEGRRWRILPLDAYSAHLSERVRVTRICAHPAQQRVGHRRLLRRRSPIA